MEFSLQKKEKASITVFLSLTVIMVISLMLSLIEVVHFTTVNAYTKAVAKVGIDSAFADYNRVLYEDYGILAVDTGYCGQYMDLEKMERRINGYLQDNLNSEGLSFIKANTLGVEILEYGLLKDNYGSALIKEAAKEVAYSIPETLLTKLNATSGLVDPDSFDRAKAGELLNDSVREIDENMGAIESDTELESNLSQEDQMLLEQNGNPIDSAKEWKNKKVLSQVLDESRISNKVFTNNEVPSERFANVSNSSVNLSVNSLEKALYTQYLKTKFSSFRNSVHSNGIDYEWEYVINGKKSDMENLEATVVKLLATREIANLSYLSSDMAKQAEAESISIAICAGLAIPILIEPIKWGIIAAWAYLESVLDVRLLLNGGKVSPIKNASEWTSNILQFPMYLDTSVMAREASMGMDYEDYLMIMTMLTSTKNLGLRSLDVLEDGIKSKEGYSDIRIENFIYSAKMSFSFNSRPIFASVTPMLNGKLNEYNFTTVEELSFL